MLEPYKILVVDDEQSTIDTHKMVIDTAKDLYGGRFQSAIILEANTSNKAIEIVDKHLSSIDLIILDNNIAEIKNGLHFPYPGIALLQIFRKSFGEKHYDLKVPVIFCTSDSDDTLKQRVNEYYGTFFPKGYDMDLFANLINDTLQRYEKEKNGLFVMNTDKYLISTQRKK